VGRTFPKVLAEETGKSELEVDCDSEIDVKLTCLGSKVGEEDDAKVEGLASEANGESVVEVKVGVIDDDGLAFEMEVGIVTGQKDQTLLPWSASY
jgi:hypothetical protein